MVEADLGENERKEGIFDVWDVPNDYARIIERHARGIIKEEVRIKCKSDKPSYFTLSPRTYVGLEIKLENERGEGVIYIPQEEFPPASELVAMGGSEIEYESRDWSPKLEGTSIRSKIKFIGGSLAGKVYGGEEIE